MKEFKLLSIAVALIIITFILFILFSEDAHCQPKSDPVIRYGVTKALEKGLSRSSTNGKPSDWKPLVASAVCSVRGHMMHRLRIDWINPVSRTEWGEDSIRVYLIYRSRAEQQDTTFQCDRCNGIMRTGNWTEQKDTLIINELINGKWVEVKK